MIRPKKHLGQHFLRDEQIAGRIAGLVNPEIPLVLEVGPGTGVLTKYLLDNPSIKPWFLEIDHESVNWLRSTYPAISGRIIEADFLEYDLGQFPPEPFHADPATEPFTLIGNFPYNISSQILFKTLEHRQRIPELIGMFQKEVAERVAAPPGNKTYGILSVLLGAWYHIDYLFTVSETVFYPPPKVKSAVIRLRRNQTLALDCDEVLFFKVVKTAFNQRRKTLRNALRSLTGDRVEISPEFAGRRAEQLTVDEFVHLAREISTFA